MTREKKQKTYVVAPGHRIEHSGDGRTYEAGAEVSLDHLAPPDVARLVQMGIVLGEPPALPVEAAGVPAGAALRLWKVGIKEPADLLRMSAESLAVMANADPGQARAWREAAQGLPGKE